MLAMTECDGLICRRRTGRAEVCGGHPVRLQDLRRPRAATSYGGRLLLTRPDQHIAWRGDETPADQIALIDRRGAASQSSEKQV